ncbi:hypothetical protein, partial [Camelimonas fluminis]
MAGLADNLPDRGSHLRQFTDRLIRLLAPQKSFVLQPFSVGQELGINHVAADSLPDLTHRFADRIADSTDDGHRFHAIVGMDST